MCAISDRSGPTPVSLYAGVTPAAAIPPPGSRGDTMVWRREGPPKPIKPGTARDMARFIPCITAPCDLCSCDSRDTAYNRYSRYRRYITYHCRAAAWPVSFMADCAVRGDSSGIPLSRRAGTTPDLVTMVRNRDPSVTRRSPEPRASTCGSPPRMPYAR